MSLANYQLLPRRNVIVAPVGIRTLFPVLVKRLRGIRCITRPNQGLILYQDQPYTGNSGSNPLHRGRAFLRRFYTMTIGKSFIG